ncbi:MAG: methyl-accepting chemotaxis protein [Desulfobacteraceae bacterium]|nr:methyl-accepting chemotaxis protein [Desulfobacteraceae bacterium]
MGRTSIKNKLILSFLALLFIVMVVVGVVNRITQDFYLAQAISSALAMVAGIIFGGVFSRSFIRRLNSLSNIAREISRGDLSKDIPLLSQDELRDLEEIFSTMVGDLRNMISDMKEVSLRTKETNSSLTDLVEKVLSNSKEIDQSARAIAKGSEEQTRIVQETSLRVDNGLKEMDEIVRQSGLTVSKINEARERTKMGEAKARETIRHLEGVLKQMAENTEPIYRLANKVEKIKLVMRVLDEIAQKTDLLSLNASIEATRAGELGKGFALVANEIRSMAENSKDSSHEIKEIVNDILEDNKAVLDSLEKSQEGINKGHEIIHGIVETFSETLSGVKGISSEVQKMEEVTNNQAKQMRGLLSHFQELSRLAHENFVATQKTTIGTKNQEEDVKKIVDSINSLGKLSEKMMEAQQRFRLG